MTILDEIIPGTIPVIREDVETEFLIELAKTGGISLTATHNWGTTSLGRGGLAMPNLPRHTEEAIADDASQPFRNLHVDKYHLKPGAASSMASMYAAAITALRKVGWPDSVLKKIRERGEKRIRASEDEQN